MTLFFFQLLHEYYFTNTSHSRGDPAIDHVLVFNGKTKQLNTFVSSYIFTQSWTYGLWRQAQTESQCVCVSLSFQLLQRHNGADRMVVLLSIYEEEDEAYQNLVTVATTFFQYLLQPFRDMRELACLYKMEILVNAQYCVCASTNRIG